VEHHKGSEARQSTMPAARKTAENSFRLPAPADRWIQAKRAASEGWVVRDTERPLAFDYLDMPDLYSSLPKSLATPISVSLPFEA
jgi:hypothetical protein